MYCFGFALTILTLSCLSFTSLAQYNQPCPLLGPVFPAPSNPSGSNAIKLATKSATNAIQAALLNATIYGQLDSSTTSFSIDVYSTHEKGSIFTYHYSAPALAHPTEGVVKVDSNTIYRIGSVSKLLTVYTYLAAAGDASFKEPVTKYIPELAAYATKNAAALKTSDIDIFDWNEITVGALASHMAGIIRDYAPNLASEASLVRLLGPVPDVNVSFCGNLAQGQLPCNRSDFFSDIALEHPVTGPFSTPIYSNAAFQILAYVLESITLTPFSTTFTNKLLKPLNLTSTSYARPPTTNPSSSIIPLNATVSWYNANLLDESPAGGYYSTLTDLRTIGRSILSSTLLTPAQTRRWLKPLTFTSDANVSVGAPWEILRAPGLNRSSYLYTKAGDIGLYSAEVALLPDYDVGFTVLTAGLQSSVNVRVVSDILAATFVPALEAAAAQEAEQIYAGTYTSTADANSSLTVVVTDGKPGLGIARWIENGIDVFPLLGSLFGVTSEQLAQATQAGGGLSVRLYPTGLRSRDGTMAVAWRAVFELFPEPLDAGAFSENCATWAIVDSLIYGAVGVDEFLFGLSVDGKEAESIEPRMLRTQLKKTSAGGGGQERR